MADNSTPDNKPCQVGNAKSSLTGILQSSLSPKYLHTNSTSHTWPFSAIAELIDNAYDPDVKASQLWIDKLTIRGKTCLSFTDNGFGMTATKLHKMLSFGFCEKVPEKGYMPVGHYGNGFKSGSMRLGKDALVLTKQETSRSVGFLSQTYLQEIEAEMVVVPLATWEKKEDHFVLKPEGAKALDDIMIFSLLRSENDLEDQFEKIPGNQGTRIIISNIRKNADQKSEFDFTTDENDIRIPDDANTDGGKYRQTKRQNHIPECDYSLKAYCAILYLKPRMQIMLRGKKVKTLNVEKSLSQTEVDRYKPTFLGEPVKVVFGFNSLNKNHYGIMMYHRNRLIKPYERVGYQLKPNNLGVGVVGVVQCDFLQPTHNKQDFDYTKQYRNEKKGVGSKSNTASGALNQPIPEIQAAPDQIWVQCDEPTCLKWRKLPDSFNPEHLPDKWYCRMNPNENYKSCDIPEERDDDDNSNIIPYAKVQKKRLEKEMQEKTRRAKLASERILLEHHQKAKQLEQKEADLKAKEHALNKQLAEIDSKPKIKTEQVSPNKLPMAQVSPRTAKVSKPLKEVSPTMAQTSRPTPKSTVTPVKHVVIQPSPVSKSNLEPKPTKTIVIKTSPGRLPASTTTTQPSAQLSQNSAAIIAKSAPILLTSGTKRLIIPATGITPTSTSQTVRFVTKGGDTRLEAGGVSIKVVKSADGRSVLLQDGVKTLSPGIAQLNSSSAKLLQNIGVTPSMDQAALTSLSSKTPVTNSNIADVKPLFTKTLVLPKPQKHPAPPASTTPTDNRYVTIAPNTQTAKAYPQIIKAVSKAAESYPEIFDAVVSNKPTDKNKTIVTGIKREADSHVNGGSPAKTTKLNTVIIVDPKVDQSVKPSNDAQSKLANSTKFAVMEQGYKEKISGLQKELGAQMKDNVALKIALEHKRKSLVEVKKELRLGKNVLDDNKKHLESISKQLEERQKAVQQKDEQLKNLRANVCRLLQVLVPEIEVDCEEGKGEGETVDELLKQVLEANK